MALKVKKIGPPSTNGPYAALKIPSFLKFVAARGLLTLAIQIQSVAVGWQLYALTKDPLSLGLLGLTEATSAIGIALYAGHIVDSHKKKNVLAFAYGLQFLTALLLIFSARQEVLKFGVWPIYLAVFLTGLARGFLSSGGFTLLGLIVPKEQYLNATTWNTSVWQAGAVAGPALGGLLYTYFDVKQTYMAALFFLFISFVLLVLIPVKENPHEVTTEPLKERLFSGIHFVLKEKAMLWAMALDMFAVLFGGAVALLPIFASDILKTGPSGLGLLRAAPAMGSIFMGLLLTFLPPIKRAGKTMLVAVFCFGLCLIGFALSTNLALSVFFLALSGACDNISVIVRHTILQLSTPLAMRGRVSAVSSIFIGSSNEIGSFESGVAAKLLGTVPSVLFGASMTLLIVLYTAIKGKELRDLNFDDLSNKVKE